MKKAPQLQAAMDTDDLEKPPPPSSVQASTDHNDNGDKAQSLSSAKHAVSLSNHSSSSHSVNEIITAKVVLKATGLDDDSLDGSLGGSLAEEATGVATSNTTAAVNEDILNEGINEDSCDSNAISNTKEPNTEPIQSTSSRTVERNSWVRCTRRSSRNRFHRTSQADDDCKTKLASATVKLGRFNVSPILAEEAQLQNTHFANDSHHSKLLAKLSLAEDVEVPRPGVFPIAGNANDGYRNDGYDGDDSIIDLDKQRVRLPGSSEVSNLPTSDVHSEVEMPPPLAPTAEPVTAELAPDPEEFEERVRTTVERQIRELRQEDMRTMDSDIPQIAPPLVIQATRIDDEVTGIDSQERSSDNTEKRVSSCCKAGLIILIFIGIGVGIALAVRSQNSDTSNNSASDNERDDPSISISQVPTMIPTNVGTTFPPTTAAPSKNPTTGPQSAEFFALLDILEPILAEGPTYNNRTNLQDPSTVEYRVLDWMANDANGLSDKLEFNVNNTYSLLERYAIAVAYHRLGGDSWKKQFRFLTGVSVCRWNDVTISELHESGVTCINDIVTSIGLKENSLSGPLPPELFHLTMLEDLMLSINEITGTIPTEIGRLTRLELFRVFDAELTGTIPTEIGMLTNLLDFHVYFNSMTGTIPTEIGNMTATIYFAVDTNQMNGTIPSEIGMMSSLLDFYANTNDFTGTVPTEVQQLTLLELFDIDFTLITGDLDPLFCDGTTLNFGPDGQLSSNCLASEDGTPPIIKCTCCTLCCNTEGRCEVT